MPQNPPKAALGALKRLIAALVAAGTAMTIAAILYLSRSGPVTGTLMFTVSIGVFVSIVLGGGLMALGFYSASSGHDIDAAGATARPQADDA